MLGLGKRGPFAFGVERRLLPRVQQIEPLLAFAVLAGVLRMHVNTKGATIDLGRAKLDQLDQRFLQAAATNIDFDAADGAVGVWYDFGQGSVQLRHDGLFGFRLAERIPLVA
jgi:hypothetical protein